MRAYVHALRSGEFEGLFAVDGPRGQLIRNAARSDIGKETDGGESSTSFEATEPSDHPGKGKAKGKDKAKGRR